MLFQGSGPIFEQSWGEQLSQKRHSVLVVGNLARNAVEVVPESVFGTLCPAEFIFFTTVLSDVLVGIAFDPEPFKLGVVYCVNRRTELYVLPMPYKQGMKRFTRSYALLVCFCDCLKQCITFSVCCAMLSPLDLST
jgi:hypothetical protein